MLCPRMQRESRSLTESASPVFVIRFQLTGMFAVKFVVLKEVRGTRPRGQARREGALRTIHAGTRSAGAVEPEEGHVKHSRLRAKRHSQENECKRGLQNREKRASPRC